MARITQANIRSSFAHYLKAMGKRPASAFNDVGGWGIDYDPTYGGYVIYEVGNASGAQHHPFGSTRMSPSTFYAALWFAIRSFDARGSSSGRDARRARPLARKRLRARRRTRRSY